MGEIVNRYNFKIPPQNRRLTIAFRLSDKNCRTLSKRIYLNTNLIAEINLRFIYFFLLNWGRPFFIEISGSIHLDSIKVLHKYQRKVNMEKIEMKIDGNPAQYFTIWKL